MKKANTDISKESSPRNKKPQKIDWAYLSYLKATGQVPVLRFTPLESPAACSGDEDKIPFGANTWFKAPCEPSRRKVDLLTGFTLTVEIPKRDHRRKTGEYLSLAEACKIIGMKPGTYTKHEGNLFPKAKRAQSGFRVFTLLDTDALKKIWEDRRNNEK